MDNNEPVSIARASVLNIYPSDMPVIIKNVAITIKAKIVVKKEIGNEIQYSISNGYNARLTINLLEEYHFNKIVEKSDALKAVLALILNNTSTCIATDATESVCSTDKFTQAMKAHVQGGMTEAGVDVKRIEFQEYSN